MWSGRRGGKHRLFCLASVRPSARPTNHTITVVEQAAGQAGAARAGEGILLRMTLTLTVARGRCPDLRGRGKEGELLACFMLDGMVHSTSSPTLVLPLRG